MREDEGAAHLRELTMSVIVSPVEFRIYEEVAFEWSIISFTESGFELSIKFEHPSFISQHDDKNILQIKIWDTFMFRRESDLA